MNRTGLKKEPLERAVKMIKANPDLFQVEGVCTHYAGAETMDNYLRIKNRLSSSSGKNPG